MLDGIRMKAPAGKNGNTVLGFRCRSIEQPLTLFDRLVPFFGHRFQQLDALPDIFQGIDDPQKCRHFHNLSAIQINTAAGCLLQKLTGRRVIERIPVIKGHRTFYGFDRIVMKKRARIRSFNQRRGVEGAVAG